MFGKKTSECNHKFEPRYDEKAHPNIYSLSGISPYEARKLMYYQVYVYDVCVKCGKTIKRG